MVRECYELFVFLAFYEEYWGGEGGGREELQEFDGNGIQFVR